MQTNLLWTGREYYSLEHCNLTTNVEGSQIDAVIVGFYENKIYRIAYSITTNALWETLLVEIHSQVAGTSEHLTLKGNGKGQWTTNGLPAEWLQGCIDVDLPLTPFTNTLPINRLKLAIQETQQITVLYLNLLEQQIKSVRQQYTRLSSTEYHYQNVPNDFEAIIRVDEYGLVVDYQELFVRTAEQRTNH